jgi:hypothetical protein
MKSLIKSLGIIAAFFLLTGCTKDMQQDVVATLHIKNYSDKNVVFLPFFISKSYTNDSILSPEVIPWDNVADYTVSPDSEGKLLLMEFEKKAIEKDNNLTVFFFDADTIAQVSWERVARENIYLERVDIHSWKELEDSNFEITYP